MVEHAEIGNMFELNKSILCKPTRFHVLSIMAISKQA
jgi:hypothetical protein